MTDGRTEQTGEKRIRALARAHQEAVAAFFESSTSMINAVATAVIDALRSGHKLLFFGNGGSAADAQHLAAEFVNRFAAEREALPAIALTTDTSILTSIANDYDFARIFSRQVEALGQQGDVALGLSTSGGSPNVLEGLRAARSRGLVTVGFTGAAGGPIGSHCDHLIAVPSPDTPRIQEVHIIAGHIICQLVDDAFAPAK